MRGRFAALGCTLEGLRMGSSIRNLCLAVAALAGLSTSASAALLINEVDSDTVNTPSTDFAEFLELYDTSGTSVPLDGKVLVLFNGNGNRAYFVQDLDGFSTNAQGFVVAGAVAGAQIPIPSNTIQNGADAITIFEGNGSDFTTGATGTLATALPAGVTLLDAIVYKTGADADGATLEGAFLQPGQTAVDEFGRDGLAATGAIDSIGRFPNGAGAAQDTTGWTFMNPTPNAANVPEPTGALIASAGLALLALRGRRSRRA